jgi:hypothetical protein
MPEAAIQYSIDEAKIKQMRTEKGATFVVLDPLPLIVDQSGGTCGIYALDRALDVRGIAHPPARKKFRESDGTFRSFKSLSDAEKKVLVKKGAYPLTSIRQQAKESGVSQVGEVLSTKTLRDLALGYGAKDAKVAPISNATALWTVVVDAIKAKRSVILSINCDAQYDAVLDGAETMGHWVILIGAYEKGTQRSILTTQVGRYDLFPLFKLWRSNDSLRKWRASQFDTIELHEIQQNGTLKVWSNLIEVGDTDSEDRAQFQLELHQDDPGTYPVFKRRRKVTFNEVNLGVTMRHQCLVV